MNDIALNHSLPNPAHQRRWQPLRAGLVNIFYYDYQEFWFRDGHLLLRGNNGTGKSKVLALTLPFLLDGQTSAVRVEPDGDPGKRMEWNLLLGDRYHERLGYSWLEFGRIKDDGQLETVTLGCGMKAVRGRPLQTWFFLTELRIGRDFWLINENDYPLNRERLGEALAQSGNVFDTASRYRRAIDEKLFHLSEERYNALINLLIQLRQPQLSKRPSLDALSAALTEALAPLDQSILTDVADAFRNLDREREELQALEEVANAVDRFRDYYRQYAQIAARRCARKLRRSQSQLEQTGAELSQTRSDLEQAEQNRQTAQQHGEQLEQQLQQARISERTLRDSPAMRDAANLRNAEQSAIDKRRAADNAATRQQQASQELERRQQRLEQARQALSSSIEQLQTSIEQTLAQARSAGIDEDHQALLLPLALPDGDHEQNQAALLNKAAQSIKTLIQRRNEAIKQLRRLNNELQDGERQLQTTQQRLQDELAQLQQLDEDRLQAEQTAAEAAQDYLQVVRDYAGQAKELCIDALDAVLEELAQWVLSLDGENPAQRAADEALQQSLRELAALEAQHSQQAEQIEQQRQQLRAEQMQLQAGDDIAPPTPHTRSDDTRAERPGAPFWQLIDFRPELAADERAGLEAALESAGLLDAWVLPQGVLLDADSDDVLLQADISGEVLLPEQWSDSSSANLNRVLLPAVDRVDERAADISDNMLKRILATIGLGEGESPIWISENGHWRLGPAYGSWRKETACYIGRGAREAARRQRLEELARLLADIEQSWQQNQAVLVNIAERRQQLQQERRQLPDSEALHNAYRQVENLIQQRQQSQQRCDRIEKQLHELRDEQRQRQQQRDDTALDLRLPSASDELDAVTTAVNEYRFSGERLLDHSRRHWDQLALSEQAAEEQERARQQLETSTEECLQLESAARAASAERDILRASVGKAVTELEQQLAETGRHIETLEKEQKTTTASLIELAARVSELQTQENYLLGRQDSERQQRREDILALQRFSDSGLLNAALSDIEVPDGADWLIDAAVRLARQIEQLLQQVDDSDSAWDRRQKNIYDQFGELQAALSRHGHEASAEQSDSGIVIKVVFQYRQCGPGELAQLLSEELRERRMLLSSRERELLETHLINEVASHLQTMISRAERAVHEMNHELEARPTSTGMTLRLVWQPLEEDSENVPSGLQQARKRLLRQVADAWSAEDRVAIGQFLQNQIETVRRNNEGGTLLEHLEMALDYRRWHRFRVERFQDGRWRSAAGPASGGERVLAATIPLFAAASAHYSSANPLAPRLVLLDEAFAGVDDDSRAKCMGLLSQFDLDFVMTSEREWGCYAELPGLAIANLARRAGIDAVHVSNWNWDGVRREQVDIAAASAQAPQQEENAEQELAETGQSSLF